MLMLICLFVICYMFYHSAEQTNRSKLFWVFNGIVLWLILGNLFLQISEKYILNINTFEDALSLGWQKLLLEGVSVLATILIAYLIQDNLSKTNKGTE